MIRVLFHPKVQKWYNKLQPLHKKSVHDAVDRLSGASLLSPDVKGLGDGLTELRVKLKGTNSFVRMVYEEDETTGTLLILFLYVFQKSKSGSQDRDIETARKIKRNRTSLEEVP